jgi:hypothetical protein
MDEVTQRTRAAMLGKLTSATPSNAHGQPPPRDVSARARRRANGQRGSTAAARAKTGKPLRDDVLAAPLVRGPKVTGYAIFDEVRGWPAETP